MYYSIIGIITIVINIIINHDVLFDSKKNKETIVNQSYRYLIYGILAYLTADVMWGVFDKLKNPLFLYVDTIIYYITMYVAVLLWAKYVVVYLDNHGKFEKFLLTVGSILLGLEVIALILNHFIHFFFWVDENANYHAYTFRYVALAIQIALFFISAHYAFAVRKQLKSETIRKRHMAIGVFGITMCIAIIVQVFFPLLPFYSIGYMLGTCLLHTYVIEDENAELQRKADEANEAKTSFLFHMSHDIRTPMNAIAGFTNMAIKHIDDKEKVLDSLSKSQQAGNMLLSLINSVLEVSRIESGNAVLEEQCGDVYYSFANIEGTMNELAIDKGINLTFEFGRINDRYVYCDFGRCMSILVNVISNSIKYTREGGFVKVKCEQIGKKHDGYGEYRYTISDNGIGMSEEFQKHVFEQFSREENTTISGIQGTGLGMTICKYFVELMNGTIECESKHGEGTTFIITLPFKLQEGREFVDPNTGEIKKADEIIADNNMNINLAGKKVLLVEDNELNREIAFDILEDKEMVVEEAADGLIAVNIVREKGIDYFDLILMDIQMPRMNGYEAAKEIRRLYPNVHIPIIALSANAFEEDRRASFNAGMDAHVAKPIVVETLIDTMIKVLNNV